jgi:ABC-type dipeptide/oligopeptide/nickel transport system permease subunit
VLVLVGIIVAIILISGVYLIVTGPWGHDDLIYPILDAILIFPTILIFSAVTKISKQNITELQKQNPEQHKDEKISSSYPIISPIWYCC